MGYDPKPLLLYGSPGYTCIAFVCRLVWGFILKRDINVVKKEERERDKKKDGERESIRERERRRERGGEMEI